MANGVLPETERKWKETARKYKGKNQSLRMNLKLHSASRVSYKQFLLFRTILPSIIRPQLLNNQTLGIAPRMTQARQLLGRAAFRDYISDLTTRQSQGAAWAGNDRLFRIPAIQQQQVIRNGLRDEGSETSVNTAIVSFLQAIADLFPQSGRQWTADRITLTADFGTVRRKRQFVAYTDGQLVDTFSREIVALIEYKRSRRAYHSPAVDMQEVAQMVAWVKQHPSVPGNGKRVLVSQDGTDIYISVFQYDQGWLRYLEGGRGSIVHAGFAYMHRYGPWNIRKAAQMNHFAEIILALLFLAIATATDKSARWSNGEMDSTRTISELKSSFIRAQVRILSESLEAPEDWRSYATASEEDDLSDKVVGDVLQKCTVRGIAAWLRSWSYAIDCTGGSTPLQPSLFLADWDVVNSALKQHNRIVYSSQAIQHVAQQVASLYWTSVNDAIRDQTSFERGIEKTVDLSNHLCVATLLNSIPPDRRSHSTNAYQKPYAAPCGTRGPVRKRGGTSQVGLQCGNLGFIWLTGGGYRYQELRERLVTLDDQRQQRRRRLEQLRRLQRLLEPFQEPQQNIQPNLITRDGELVQELEKMRMLVARVGGRIQHSKKRGNSQEDPTSYQLDSDQKLEALLDMNG
ncbi:hypothetical protein APSETT445_000464 [Aspergillus pseudonomiae]